MRPQDLGRKISFINHRNLLSEKPEQSKRAAEAARMLIFLLHCGKTVGDFSCSHRNEIENNQGRILEKF